MRTLTVIIATFILQATFGQGPGEPENYLKARSLMKIERYDSALQFLNLAVQKNPGDVDAIYNRGICNYELKRYEAAISDFLFTNKRRSAQASLMLAKTEARLNHQELAIKYLKEHLGSYYRIPEKEILLEKDFASLENTAAWKSLWKEKEWYTQFDRDLQEVSYLRSKGRTPEAINLLHDLDKKGFKRSDVNQQLAEIYMASGNQKAALKVLDKSIASDTRNMEALKLRIKLYMLNGDYAHAKKDCDRLLRQAPDEFDHYLVSARISSKLGNYKDALRSVEFYLALYPDSHQAYNELGEIQYDNGKFLDALTSFNKTLELESGEAGYYFNRGRTYAAAKTYKYAEKDFSMALDLDPADPETWYFKGLTDLELGKKEIACYNFKKALQLGKFEARDYINRICGN
ncbi:MAG: tetratricopeptide repeat protein [Bacteroidales bacterium]